MPKNDDPSTKQEEVQIQATKNGEPIVLTAYLNPGGQIHGLKFDESQPQQPVAGHPPPPEESAEIVDNPAPESDDPPAAQ